MQFFTSGLTAVEFYLQQSLITREMMRIQIKNNQDPTYVNPIQKQINQMPIKWQKNLIKLIHSRALDITQQSGLFEFKIETNRIQFFKYNLFENPIEYFRTKLPNQIKETNLTIYDYHPLDNINQFTIGKHQPLDQRFDVSYLDNEGEIIKIQSYKNVLQGQHNEARKDRVGCLMRKILLIQHMTKYKYQKNEISTQIYAQLQNLLGEQYFTTRLSQLDINGKINRKTNNLDKLYKAKIQEIQQTYKTKRFTTNMNQKDLFKILLAREFSPYDSLPQKRKTFITDIELQSTPIEIRILLITEIIKTKLKQSFKCTCNICKVIIQSRQDFTYMINNQQLFKLSQKIIASISEQSKKSEVPSIYYSIIHENLYHLSKDDALLITNQPNYLIDSLIINFLVNLYSQINLESPEVKQSDMFKKYALPQLIVSPTNNFILHRLLNNININNPLLDPFVKDNGLINYGLISKYLKQVKGEKRDQIQ